MPSAAAFALAVLKHAPVLLGLREQRALFDALLSRGSSGWRVEPKKGVVSLSHGEIEATLSAPKLFEEVERRVHLLNRMHARIERRTDINSGAPVFKGTRASVARVGALLHRPDVTRREVAEDYPQLSSEDLDIAELYMSLKPRPRGRPPKRLVLRRG